MKITAEIGQTVPAIDAAFDKLPDELSAEDMKVATLWLLSPKRTLPDRRGAGLKMARYESSAPMRPSMQLVANVRREHLPKTASNTFSLAACALRLRRTHAQLNESLLPSGACEKLLCGPA